MDLCFRVITVLCNELCCTVIYYKFKEKLNKQVSLKNNKNNK